MLIHPPTSEAITLACECLSKGQLVGIPTETVYGLAADASQPEAVAKIYQVKNRPSFNPLIIHVSSLAMAERFGEFGRAALALAEAFWPGPLTLIVKLKAGAEISPLALDGGAHIGLRFPAHPLAQSLIEAFGKPLAAPSANRSGRVSPTAADHVLEDLGQDVAMVLDGGPGRFGLESTIVACPEDESLCLLRPGALSREQIENAFPKLAWREREGEGMAAPGQQSSHYATSKPIRLGATHAEKGEALLAFGEPLAEGSDQAETVFQLSENGDLLRAAARLFQGMRELDKSAASRIAVMPIPEHGLGLAINDRLRRAAAPKQ